MRVTGLTRPTAFQLGMYCQYFFGTQRCWKGEGASVRRGENE